jgi:hypothetical protein
MEEFVTKLKALAGPNVLVQAVGIGKGKEDLTAALSQQRQTKLALLVMKFLQGRHVPPFLLKRLLSSVTGDLGLAKLKQMTYFGKQCGLVSWQGDGILRNPTRLSLD